MISLASLAGERMFFEGDSSVGVGGDLRSATMVAMQMEGFAAMGQTVASHLVTKVSNARQQGESVETGTDRMWLVAPTSSTSYLTTNEGLYHTLFFQSSDRGADYTPTKST